MKKLAFFLPIFIFCFSCSAPENEVLIPTSKRIDASSRPRPGDIKADPSKLTRVVFFPGQTHEKRLNFYPNGLLKSIANQSGMVYQTFHYDSNNNLIQVNGLQPQIFTYDSNNLIASWNGKAVVYDAVANKYVVHYPPVFPNDPECPTCYDYIDRNEILLSSERLMIANNNYFTTSDGDYMTHGFISGYTPANNMAYIQIWSDPSGPSYMHDDKVNPLKAAMLPACRAMSIVGQPFLEGIYCSANNVVFNGYGDTDPESEEYVITYNANNLPVSIISKFYYFQTLESTRLYAKFYYQSNSPQ